MLQERALTLTTSSPRAESTSSRQRPSRLPQTRPPSQARRPTGRVRRALKSQTPPSTSSKRSIRVKCRAEFKRSMVLRLSLSMRSYSLPSKESTRAETPPMLQLTTKARVSNLRSAAVMLIAQSQALFRMSRRPPARNSTRKIQNLLRILTRS